MLEAMKRKWGSLCVAGLALLGLSSAWGCVPPPQQGMDADPGNPVDIVIIGARAGSTSQLRADAIAEAVRLEHSDWKVTSRAAGSPAHVIAARVASEADFFFTNGSRQLEIVTQEPLHPDSDFRAASDYRIVMPTSLMHTHFFARGRSGLAKPADIVESQYPFRIGTGSVSEVMFNKMLEYYGSSAEEAVEWGGRFESLNMTSSEGADALQSGRVNLGFTSSGIPNSFFQGLTGDIILLPLDDSGLVSMFGEWGYLPSVIPAGTYSFVIADIPTVAALQSLSTLPDMPDHIVYGLLEAVFRHLDLITVAQGEASDVLTAEYLSVAVPLAERSGEPYHPAALSFYRDIGWVS